MDRAEALELARSLAGSWPARRIDDEHVAAWAGELELWPSEVARDAAEILRFTAEPPPLGRVRDVCRELAQELEARARAERASRSLPGASARLGAGVLAHRMAHLRAALTWERCPSCTERARAFARWSERSGFDRQAAAPTSAPPAGPFDESCPRCRGIRLALVCSGCGEVA